MSATQRQQDELRAQLDPVVAGLGYEIEDLVVQRVGRRISVRITVDADNGVDLDAIADVSRAVGESLDGHDPFDVPFVLEVSSPGIDRPLIEPRHWRRNVGRLVATTVADEAVTGRVIAVDPDGLSLAVDSTTTVHPWSQVGSGRVQVEFNRAKEHAREEG